MTSIDTTAVMYETLQCCRIGDPRAGRYLAALRSLLEKVRHTGSLDVTVDDAWLAENSLVGEQIGVYRTGNFSFLGEEPCRVIGPQNERFFGLVEIAARDLARLNANGALKTVRRLGYALHNVPQFLRHPDSFGHCVFGISTLGWQDWNDLALEMRRALCAVQNIDIARAEAFLLGKN